MAKRKEWGINYWDSKNKKTRTRQRYERTYTRKADAKADAFAFFSPYEAARIVRVNVPKGRPPQLEVSEPPLEARVNTKMRRLVNVLINGKNLKAFDRGVQIAQKEIEREAKDKKFAVKMGIDFSQCDNCGYRCSEDNLINPIPDLSERIDPGGIVPSGECPKCGALCFPVEAKSKPALKLLEPVVVIEGGIVQDVFILDASQREGTRQMSYELVDYDVFDYGNGPEAANMWNGFSPALKSYFEKHLPEEFAKFQESVAQGAVK